jgi:hypothetical protein
MKSTTKYLLNALFKYWNHYQAVLPYNLNWQITLGSHEKALLSQNPLVVCDVGARGSAPEELSPFFGEWDRRDRCMARQHGWQLE